MPTGKPRRKDTPTDRDANAGKIQPRRSNGFLSCSNCKRSLAFQGIDDPTTWPLHRCGSKGVQPFTLMSDEDPNHVPLDPPTFQEPRPRDEWGRVMG